MAPAGYVDPNFPNPHHDGDTSIIIYGYTPSISLAALAATWFFVLLVVHVGWIVKHKCWWFITVPVGLAFEVVGYIARSLSAKKDPYKLTYFIINYFFIVTAPVFLAAGIYTVLSAMLNRLGGKLSPVRPRLILWFFIVSDVIATGLQVAGAALIGVSESNHKDTDTPNNILLGGLAYQVFSMTVFVVLTASVFVRARSALHLSRLAVFAAIFSIATVMLYLRTIFRLGETAQGLFGNLSTHEVYFGCLEFAPVALCVLLLAVWHPGYYLGSIVRQEHAKSIGSVK